MTIWNVLIETRACITSAETRRLIYGGGIKVDGVYVANPDYIVPDGEHVVSVGARTKITVNIERGLLKSWQK